MLLEITAYTLGLLSLTFQFLVVYYGVKLYKVVGNTEYWSIAWKLYLGANSIILLRRMVSLVTILVIHCEPRILRYVIVEEILAIAVSILLLLFGKKLNCLFASYIFKHNKEK